MTLQDAWDTFLKNWIQILTAAVPIAVLAYVLRQWRGPLWPVLGPRSLWPWGRALALLKASNASTLDLYEERVHGRKAPNRYHSWDNVFDRSDWTALKSFEADRRGRHVRYEPTGSFDGQPNVRLAERVIRDLGDVDAAAPWLRWLRKPHRHRWNLRRWLLKRRRHLVHSLRSLGNHHRHTWKRAVASPSKRKHIWITGEATAGRSALLLHVFFVMLWAGQRADRDRSMRARLRNVLFGSGRVQPVPMLLRPGHLAVGQIDGLRFAGSMEPILAAWLGNRGVNVRDADRPALARELSDALREGRVVVLLDRYDTFADLGLDVPVDYLLEFPLAVVSAAAARSEAKRSIARLPPISERYRDGFGAFFAEHQNWLLAGDFAGLEDTYTQRIERAVAQASRSADKVYLIDIMAGGATSRWRHLMAADKLHVLAIDRDGQRVSQLSDDKELGSRYHPWQIELKGPTRDPESAYDEGNIVRKGGLRLRAKVRDSFRDPRAAVDVIVGKKALHEIKRDLQRTLICDCYSALRGGGTLILFTNSMGYLTAEDRDLLEFVRTQVARSANAAAPPDSLRDLVLGLTFTNTEASVGLFCNVWVMLKDRANGNLREVRNRYFAGPLEIEEWATAAGFEPVRPAGGDGAYRISTTKFNEDELRKAFDFLDESTEVVSDDVDSLFSNIVYRQGPWLSLLVEFADRHLYAGGRRTLLGTKLHAKVSADPWVAEECSCPNSKDVTQLLGMINDAAGLTFDLPVHVLEFTKPVRRAVRTADAGSTSIAA